MGDASISSSNPTPPVSPPVTPPPVAGPIIQPTPVTPPPAAPVTPPASGISCGQLVEALAWDSAINPYSTVVSASSGVQIHYTKKSTSVSYKLTNFDPVQAGFSVKFIPSSGNSVAVPAASTLDGVVYGYMGEYGSVNLKIRILNHSSLADITNTTAELSCGGRVIA